MQSSPRRRGPVQAVLAVAVVGLAMSLIAFSRGWFGPNVGVAAMYCEASTGGLVDQPVNAWSALGFVVAGLGVAAMATRDHLLTGTLAARPWLLTWLGCILVVIAYAAMSSHATGARAAQAFDDSAMYLFGGFAWGYVAMRLLGTGPWILPGAALCSLVVSWILSVAVGPVPGLGDPGYAMFAALLAITTLMELRLYVRGIRRIGPRQEGLYGLTVYAVLCVAGLAWAAGQTELPWCDPHSALQLHAVWHLLTALAVFVVTLHFVREGRLAR